MENKIKSIKLKIEESNHFQIQKESVLLIHQLLLNEKSQQIFDSSLNLFLQLIYSPYVHVIETTIECIINLVKIKKVTREIILNKLLESIVSIDKSMVGVVVKAIFTLSIDIEYMSKIIKELNSSKTTGSSGGNIVYTLNTLTKQFSISRPEIYESISEEIELILLLDTQIPPSLREQRFDFLKPILSNLLLNSNELPMETSLLHNTLVRIAHDVPNLYQPILSFLTSLLFLYSSNNNSNNNISQQQFNQKIQFIRDLIDLIRFPPSTLSPTLNSSPSSPSSSCKELKNEFTKSILSILYYLLNIFVNSKQVNHISIRNSVLVHLKDLVLLDPCIVWYQSFNSSLNNYNTPIIIVLLLFLPSSVSSIQQKILELLQISIDYLPTKITSNNQYSIITSLRLSVSPLIRMISVSSSNSQHSEIYKKLLKDIEVLISNISLKIDNKEYISNNNNNNKNFSQDDDQNDEEDQVNKSSDKMINLDNAFLLDNFIVINLAWNLLISNRNGELVYNVLPTWLNILNSNLKLNQDKLNEKENLEKKKKKSSESSSQQQQQQQVIELNNSVEFSNEFLIFFLSPFLLFKHNQQDELSAEIRIEAIHLLPIISRRPIESISIIPLFFYSIQREEKSQVILELFETLPELSKNKDCFASVLKILSNLDQQQQKKKDSSSTSKSILPSFILRIYCKLWKVNSLVFPKIEEIIYSIIQQIQDSNNNNNIDQDILFQDKLSTALTIRDICEFEPNQGQELIQPLSQFLCKETNPTILALSLEALSSLCKYEILSFTSAWNVIKKHLGQEEGFENDKRSPIVLIALLEFFSNATVDFEGQSNLEQKTIDVISDIIRRVWNLSNENQDNKVSSKSYWVLSKYIKSLENQELLEKIQSKTPLLLERLSNLSKGQQVDSNFVLLLNSLLEKELNEKRSLKTAHQNIKQTKSVSIFNSGNNNKLLKIMELLEDELEEESRTGIKSGIILGLLWFNSDSTKQDGSGNEKKETKKEILMNFKFNKSLLNDSIEFLDNSRDLLSKLMSLGAWGRFMNECFTAYEKNDIMRQSLPSGTKLSIKETHEKVFDEIQEQLLETITSNPSSIQAENSIFALVMMSRNLSRVCYSKMESVFNQLLKWVTEQKSIFSGNADLVYGASYLGLGILAPFLLADSSLLKEAISSLEFSATSNESNLNENIKFNCYLALGICSSQLLTNQVEKKRINLILFNSFINYFGSNDSFTKINESMVLSGLCLAIGYSSNSFEELSMTDNLLKIYEIIQSKLLNNQQFINDCPLSYGLLLISFSSIVSSCFKLNILSTNEIKSQIIPFYQNTGNKSSIYHCIGFNNLIQALLRQGYTDLDLQFIESILISNKKIISDSTTGSSSLDKINSVLSTSILLGSPILTQSSSCLDSTLESSVLDFINSQPSSRKDFKQLLDEIIDSMVKLFENSNSDSKTIRYTSICLGSITIPIGKRNSSSSSSSSTTTQEPENYDHLPNELFVKNLFNYLVSSPSLPKKSSEETIECCIKVFSKADGVKMPLANWSTIIKRLYNQSDNIKVKKQCIEFAAENITLSSLSIVVSEWLSVSQFKNSPISIQKKLLKVLPKVLNHLTPARINSIFDDILFNISNQTIQIYKDKISNLFLLWKILGKSLNQQAQNDDDEDDGDDEFNFNIKYSKDPLLNEIKEILFKFIISNIKLLPSPYNDENELLSSENIKLLNVASESIFHLSKEKIQTYLPLLSGINDIDNEAKIQYLYVLVLGKGALGKASLSNFYKIKAWCFSSSDATQQSKVLSILPLILTKPLVDNQVQFGFNSILNDIFDSIALTTKQHIIGLELLSQLISNQINLNIFEFNSFFNLYNNVNINSNQEEKDSLNIIFNFRYLELLPFYFKVLFSSNNQLDGQDIINRLTTILQSKCSCMDNKVKSIVFSSILTLKQLNIQQQSNSSQSSQQQLTLFNLYKLLK